MKIFFKLSTFIGVLILASCDKSTHVSVVDILSKSPWYLKGMMISPPITIGNITTSDLYNDLLKDCERDNVVILKSNGEYIDDEGISKCSPLDPQTKTGQWYLSPDEKRIFADTTLIEIVSLSDKLLIVNGQLNILGIQSTVTITYIR